MSNHRTARSNADPKLTKAEIRRFKALLTVRSEVLFKYPAIVRSLLEWPSKIDDMFDTLILKPRLYIHRRARKQWESFYKEYFDLTTDFSKVVIPKQRQGFTRLVIVAQEITLSRAMATCEKHFLTSQHYIDLDKGVTKNDRTAKNAAYAVWFRNRIEADEELADKSANQLQVEGVLGITLLERILLELEYFCRTGQHLDIESFTLCAGSRDSGGNVPLCTWGHNLFRVGQSCPDESSPASCAREAVF